LAYLSFEEHKNMSEIVNGADKDIKRKSYTDPNRDFISQLTPLRKILNILRK
jgi:hypothetical protein